MVILKNSANFWWEIFGCQASNTYSLFLEYYITIYKWKHDIKYFLIDIKVLTDNSTSKHTKIFSICSKYRMNEFKIICCQTIIWLILIWIQRATKIQTHFPFNMIV